MPDSNLTLLNWSTSFWTQPLGFKYPEQFKLNVAFSILGYFLFLGSTWKVVYIYRTWDLLSCIPLLLFLFGPRRGDEEGWSGPQQEGKTKRCGRDLTPLRHYGLVQINTIGKNIMSYTCLNLSFAFFLFPLYFSHCLLTSLILIMND